MRECIFRAILGMHACTHNGNASSTCRLWGTLFKCLSIAEHFVDLCNQQSHNTDHPSKSSFKSTLKMFCRHFITWGWIRKPKLDIVGPFSFSLIRGPCEKKNYGPNWIYLEHLMNKLSSNVLHSRTMKTYMWNVFVSHEVSTRTSRKARAIPAHLRALALTG